MDITYKNVRAFVETMQIGETKKVVLNNKDEAARYRKYISDFSRIFFRKFATRFNRNKSNELEIVRINKPAFWMPESLR